jgi:hypothetical protein
MTLRDLINEFPEHLDTPIVMSKDSEGNGYSPLSGGWLGNYKADTTWYGEVGMSELTQEDIDNGYTEEDVIEGELSLILSPIC